ncbi:hypothetical protein [Anaerococcus hydrogenalis]|jgi:hypothetical protein|uniref:hypothetical protein n=1 Tax=Anaerococcus hydrogenalis TaxID=33029 RepID=UPI0029020AF9|nr:hypothetical protein [Anaerococcus hydrogenalis]MDU1315698.1 hypothetical protein [Anaerococcus hydrogenalis]
MKIILMNPYYDEEIEVLEDLDYFNKSYKNILNGNEESIKLTQIKCMDGMGAIKSDNERIIFINPRHWAKVEVEE